VKAASLQITHTHVMNMHTLKRVQYCSDNFGKFVGIFLVVKLYSVDLSRVVAPLVEHCCGLVVFQSLVHIAV